MVPQQLNNFQFSGKKFFSNHLWRKLAVYNFYSDIFSDTFHISIGSFKDLIRVQRTKR